MSNTSRFATKLANLGVVTRLAMGLSLGLIPSCALDDQTADPTDDTAAPDDTINSACSGADGARFRCFAKIKASSNTGNAKFFAAPTGFGAPDLQLAYNIDINTIPATVPTIAIVDAYGYTALESDLAKYRTQYGLPACTVANGCLKIVNATGQTSPLPNNPPANDDWTVETALDVDMASAACPKCKILVVQATDPGQTLLTAQAVAKSLGATVISNSWGGPEQAGSPATADESNFNQPGVSIFVSSGDNGYNDAGQGPDYPATSAYAIAVGGTNLKKDASPRGWSETAWTMGGSACSLSIPKPAYQDLSPCTYKATTDIAAVGDPATGLAVYNAANGGWISVGGTSASSPFVAGIFAATGNGGVMTGKFVKDNVAKLNDVASGTNGTCTGKTLLCTAGAGWDGPTGYGTPNARMLVAGATTNPDPTNPDPTNPDPTNPGTPPGTTTPPGSAPPADVVGGCSAGGGTSGAGLILALGMLMIRRKRS